MGRKLERFLPHLGFIAILAIAPVQARAQSGDTFWETMGFSVAVGTVLGASSLPFYDQPGQHLPNLLLGAAVGAVFGMGWHLFSRSEDSDAYSRHAAQDVAPPLRMDSSVDRGLPPGVLTARALPRRSATIWMPVVSFTW